MKWSSRECLIALNMIPGIGGRRLQSLLKHFGSFQKCWQASSRELLRVPGFGRKTVSQFVNNRGEICPFKEQYWAQSHQAEIVTIVDQEYPEYLHRLVVPPPVLYVKGRLPQKPGIAIVGTRRPSQVGIVQTRKFTTALVQQGEVIVSGLARGIDYIAHESTLQGGGVTVAILGSNIENIYPREHDKLVQQIAQQGAVVSEFSSRCPTVPGNFPRRNRIIAGFSRGVLVVQAGERSGALGTSDWALELGLEVWAIPGEISDPLRKGTNRLIKQGAHLVVCPTDLGVRNEQHSANNSPVTELAKEGLTVNEIALRLKLSVEQVMAEIALERFASPRTTPSD